MNSALNIFQPIYLLVFRRTVELTDLNKIICYSDFNTFLKNSEPIVLHFNKFSKTLVRKGGKVAETESKAGRLHVFILYSRSNLTLKLKVLAGLETLSSVFQVLQKTSTVILKKIYS